MSSQVAHFIISWMLIQ